MKAATAKTVHTVDFGDRSAQQRTDAATGRVPRVVQMLALAHRIDSMIRNGELRDFADASRAMGLTRARVTQIMNLLLLAPEIQEAILELPLVRGGRDPITERTLRSAVREWNWSIQRAIWKTLEDPKETNDGNRLEV